MIDDDNYLYITGDSLNDIWTTKVDILGGFRWGKTFSNLGFDRGMDIAVYNNISERFVFVTGYIQEPNTDKNDIVLIKYDYINGNILMIKKFGNQYYDDIAYGISLDENGVRCRQSGKRNKFLQSSDRRQQ